MGDWHWPEHYTDEAKAFHREHRGRQIRHFAEYALPSLRVRARALGYALTVHGSLERDFDLVACPWIDEASDVATLIAAISEETKRLTGWGHIAGRGAPTPKPLGRVATTIIATAEFVIDLSIMPRGSPP